jgi:enoyl-CoA hydratase
MPTAVEVSRDGHIVRLTLRSADGQNLIDSSTIAELCSACDTVANANDVRVVIVSGAEGGSFSAGWTDDFVDACRVEPGSRAGDPFGCLAELPLPAIAAIRGEASSAGLELALACDLRVAERGARFAFPETGRGYIPLAGGTQRLPRAIGYGRAAAMILLGEEVDAATAHAWGLLNAVAEPGRLEGLSRRLAETIAARGPIAERFAKEAVHHGVEMPLARALRYELDLTVLLQTTEDRAEGVRAFAEKRQPKFSGR